MKNFTKKIAFSFAFLFMVGFAFGQTTYNWRDEVTTTSGDWNVAVHWWNGTTTEIPNGADILEFNNHNNVAMTNNLTATNRHKITFNGGATTSRLISGTTENTFHDYGGAWPWIKNSATATLHEINFPVKASYTDFELIADTGPLKFGETIDNDSNNIHIYGNNTGSSVSSRYIELSKGVTGVGKLIVSQFGVSKISAPDLPAVAYSGNTEINRGELWIETNDAIGTSSPIYVGDGTEVAHETKLFLSKLDGGINFTNDITINPGNNERRFLGGLNNSGTNTFLGNINIGNNELNIQEVLTAGNLIFSGVISGTGAIKTVGNGTVLLAGTNTYTGLTNVSGGTLELAGNNVIDDNSKLNINGGTFSTGVGFSDTLNTLILENTGTISLATNSVLSFNNSNGETWVSGKVLHIEGWNEGGRIFVGVDATGLDAGRLAQIQFEGFPTGAIILPTGEIIPTILSAVGDIIITEIMVDPATVTDANGEWFEIYNTTASDINIQGWVIADSGTTSHMHIITSSVIVPTHGFVLLAKNANSGENGGLPLVTYDYNSLIFTNTDEVSISFGALVIDAVSYDGVFPAVVEGKSMTLRDTKFTSVLNDSGYSWCHGVTSYGTDGNFGTPGTANDDCKCENLEIVKWESSAWTDESGNPMPTPSTENNIEIRQSYNTSDDGGSIEACNCKVMSGGALTITANYYLKTLGDIEISAASATIKVEHEGSVVQVYDDATVTGSGTYTTEKTTTPYHEYDYTYFSSPSSTAVIANAFSASNQNYIWTMTTANMDTFANDGDDWALASGIMTPGVGYAVLGSAAVIPFDDTDFSYPNTDNVSFDGPFNNGDKTVNLVIDSYQQAVPEDAPDDFPNLNLIGNPYPSAIDIHKFQTANAAVVGSTFHFWTHNDEIQAGGTGSWAYNFQNDDYATYNVNTGGVAANTAIFIPDQFVPSCQGFLAEATTAGPAIFTNAMRETGNNDHFLSPMIVTEDDNDKLWLNLIGENEDFRQILVGFFDEAVDTYDGYESQRMPNGYNTDFYSVIPDDSRHFAIQGLHTFNIDKVVPLGLEIVQAGEYTISIDHMEGVFGEGQTIYIYDNQTGAIHNLTTADYVFTTEIGEIDDRLEIRFKSTVGIDEDTLSFVGVYPNPSDAIFNITWRGNANAQIQVVDLAGKVIVSQTEINSPNKTYELDMTAYTSGIYFVKLVVGQKQIVKKLILK